MRPIFNLLHLRRLYFKTKHCFKAKRIQSGNMPECSNNFILYPWLIIESCNVITPRVANFYYSSFEMYDVDRMRLNQRRRQGVCLEGAECLATAARAKKIALKKSISNNIYIYIHVYIYIYIYIFFFFLGGPKILISPFHLGSLRIVSVKGGGGGGLRHIFFSDFKNISDKLS